MYDAALLLVPLAWIFSEWHTRPLWFGRATLMAIAGFREPPMTPLRFVMLTTFYPPFNFGGDGVDVQNTARALVGRGHHVTVVHDVDAYEMLAGARLRPQPVDGADGVEVVSLRSRLGALSPILTHQLGFPVVHGRTIAEVIRQRNADVIIFHNVSLIGGPGLLAVDANALKVYFAHEHWLVCPTHVLFRFNREPCDARACTRCVLSYRRPPQLWRYTGALERRLSDVDVFIARSEFSRQKHLEFGFSKPMQVLPYFVPGPLPAERTPRSSESPHPRPYFLYVGRLTRFKGVESLIPAFARYPDADLLIAGDGEEAAALHAQAAGSPNVKFLGRIVDGNLTRYYEHAIALLVPSHGFETFCLVVIEAFRTGTPVIARRRGSLAEIVEQSGGGLLYSEPDELQAAMTHLQTDPSRRGALGADAYRACRERWSEEVIINRLLEIIAAAR